MVDKEGEGRPFLPCIPPLDRSVDIGDEKELHQAQASDPVRLVPTPDVAMESELALVTVAQTEVVILGPDVSVQVQNGASNSTTTGSTKETKLNFDLKLSVLLITLSMIPLTDILFLHGPTAKLNLTLKLSAFFAFTALTSAISLMFQTFKLKAVVRPEQFITKSQLRVSKILSSVAVGSLFLTCTAITYSLLPKAYYFLPVALLPSLLVGGFHFLYGVGDRDTDNGEIISSAQSKALKKELKRATQLTLSLVSTSFSGFVGVLLAIYHKAESLGAAYSYIKVAVYLLLGGSAAGMLALLLCRQLSSSSDDNSNSSSSSNNNNRRQQWGTAWQRAILSAANIVMAAMLVSAVLMIAETILHGLLAGAMFPVIAGAAAWLLVEFCSVADAHGGRTEEDGKAAHGTMYAIAVAVASLSFGAILAIFGGLLGGTVSKEQLKACTFLLASAFVAAVSLGAVTTWTAPAGKAKVSTEFAATVLACCGLGTLVLAALALFYQILA